MPGTYDLGETVNLEIELSDPDTGDGVTTGDLICHVQPPTGAVVNVAPVTLVTAGGVDTPSKYRARFVSTMAGEHWYQFTSAALGVVKEGALTVRASRVA